MNILLAMSFSERMSYGVQVLVIGLGTVFSALVVLWLVLTISRYFAYDLPKRKKASDSTSATPNPEAPAASDIPLATDTADDGQLIAVITAAVASYISADTEGSALPFRVVSYKRVRSANGWNGLGDSADII